MLNLEPELVQLGAAAPLIARERRDIVSVYAEVRMMAWAGVMLIVTGAGIILSHNLDRIGPVAIAVVVGAASLACYAYCVWRRATVHSEFVLLLGALLLSADLGYIEHQFHLFGSEWTAHFFVLAVIHGATAYYFDSATLLSLSIAALASWFGIERNVDTFFTNSVATSMRAFVCAAVVGTWRFGNRRPQFERTFDHFIANLALWGGLILTFQKDTRPAGALLVVVMAALVIAYGFRKRREAFVMYAYVYAVIAVTIFIATLFHDETLIFLILTIVMVSAIAGLLLLHARFRRLVE